MLRVEVILLPNMGRFWEVSDTLVRYKAFVLGTNVNAVGEEGTCV
jgi:hypothetical protein